MFDGQRGGTSGVASRVNTISPLQENRTLHAEQAARCRQPRMGMTSAFTRCCLNHSLQPAQAWKREQRGQRRSADHLVIFINTGDVHVNIFVGVSAYHVRACLSCCRRFFKQGSIFQPIGELRQKNAPSGRHGLIQCTNRGFVSIQQDSLQLCRGPVGLN